MKFNSALFLLPALSAAIPTLSPRQAPRVIVTNIAASGSGCPAGSFSADISSDNVTATVGFSSYEVFIGPNTSGTDRERNCDIVLTLQYPIGCTTAALEVGYHGFAQLENGVTATLSSSFSLSRGSLGPTPGPTSISGPVWVDPQDWAKEDTITSRVTVNNANQRIVTLTVRNRIFLTNRNSNQFGHFREDDLTVRVEQQAAC